MTGEPLGSSGRDPAGFDAFYATTAGRLVRQLHAMTGDLGEAQDCVQDAYARAWQRWDRVAEYEQPEAWVRTVAWRIAVSRFRRARAAVRALGQHGPPAHAAALSPDRVALIAALGQLPAAQRRAIVLHHVAGLTVAEVGAETGAPIGTVKARLSRGRAALALLLADDRDVHTLATEGDARRA